MWVEKHGPTYRIRDLVGGKKVDVRTGLPNKTIAREVKRQLEVDKARGDQLVPRGGDLTLNGWIEVWWPSYEVTLKQSSRVSAQGIVDRYISPMLGNVPLGQLDPVVIQRWVADLLAGRTKVKTPKPLSRKTAANAHGMLHKILGEAVAQRLIRANPCERTRMPQKVHHEMQFLTEPEAHRLVAAVPEHYRPLVRLLLGTGLRWGEAVGLQVRDVDVLAGRLQVRRNLQELAQSGAMVEEAPKTAAGRRTVTFTRDIADMLIELVVGKEPTERVFLAPKGGEVRYRVFFPVWDRARKAAGLPRVRIHDLRHTHATWLIAANVKGGLTTVQRRLGHSSYNVTSDIYGHLMQETDDDVLAALDLRMTPRGGLVGERTIGQDLSEPVRTGEDRS